jgi:predicted AlkP superfamily pyrophosphatase or phosphodiesterase
MMTKWNSKYLLVFIIGIIAFSACSRRIVNSTNSSYTINSKDSTDKPYLILISLDGFRWDYVERFKPPHLSNFIKNGVKAESLIPSFPSKTFPNHYTIATGMYPDTHGILGNIFYNYKNKTTYNIKNRGMVEDGSYYGGSPIWVQAAKAGIVTASYFFAGTEADIQGYRPDYYYKYDGNITNEVRVEQAVKWLEMPEKNRPHLITLYFSDMDDMGHRYGPNADSILKKTLYELDNSLGHLFKQIDKLALPVNIIIVSDHGMLEIPVEKYLAVEMIENNEQYLTINSGAIASIHPKDHTQTEFIFNQLKKKENHFSVYKTENTPGFEYIPKNKDWGPIQIVPEIGYYFTDEKSIASMKQSPQNVSGVHGYDPTLKDMHGIFYANGPALKKGYKIHSIKNIHVYPVMCKILGLELPNDIDGKLNKIENILLNHKR